MNKATWATNWETNRHRQFIVMSPAETKGFQRQEDREFFSGPVEVKVLWSEFPARFVYCVDSRGLPPYPTDGLKSYYQLTLKQREAIRPLNG